MIGLAASPGTDVEPTCSTRTATGPNAARMRDATAAYCCGHAGSGVARRTGPECVSGGRTNSGPAGIGTWSQPGPITDLDAESLGVPETSHHTLRKDAPAQPSTSGTV